jgi:hypothetical protein
MNGDATGLQPAMNAPLQLYEYREGEQPRYEAVLLVNGQ